MPIPTDPLLAQQWHLIQSNPNLLDLNVRGAWEQGYTGAGIRVFVIDDGFDYNHVDLAPNYNQNLDYDYVSNTGDPFGNFDDSHGTAVMGIIGAAANGTGAVGVAYQSEIIGYRLYGLISNQWLNNVRDGIRDAADNGGDVINISQGMANAASTLFGTGLSATAIQEIRTSIGHAVDTGRDGFGTMIAKSAGNSRGTNFDVNADPWTNDTRQVVVAAVDQNGYVSSYSSHGAANLVSAFGTPGEVVTTDRTGSAGYDPGDYTSGFNGTSAAAPEVAGVMSLILDANEGLGWRDVQDILAYSARHVGSAVGAPAAGSEFFSWSFNGARNWNGGGLHFSNDYGFGLVDARAATRLAESWLFDTVAHTSANQTSTVADLANFNATIPDGNTTGTTFNITESDNILVERVALQIDFTTTYVSDVIIRLTSPNGTVSTLLYKPGLTGSAGGTDFSGYYTLESQQFRGESSAGTWQVQVVDAVNGDTLTVRDLILTTYGASQNINDRYVYTDEFSDYAGTSGHATTINDTNGSSFDVVNASAVSTASTINLDGSASTIDGVTVYFNGVDDAIGGDGADTLRGNGLANYLWGMRGSDILDGGAGADTMYGGSGGDRYYVDNAGDVVDESAAGSDGYDVVWSSISTNLADTLHFKGAVEAVRLTGAAAINATGNALANQLIGNNNANWLDGGAGADLMQGLAGHDRYYVDNAGDIVDESVAGSDGYDVVWSTISVNLFDSAHFKGAIEAVRLTGNGAINATGNGFGNALIGNNAANWLDGAAGADTMQGLGG
ncbi:S8 family serine peptidase, partial [Mangrovicella endophytica]|uniref:S8 family serine peptidase n=1 Tax=Mangrovicella endophytica TaxID=2066697 RepID=UPI000C9E6197